MAERKPRPSADRNGRDDGSRGADHAAIDRLADDLLPALVAKLGASGLAEIEIREGAWSIRLRRPSGGPNLGRRATDGPSRQQPGHAGHGHAPAAVEGHRSVGARDGFGPLAAVGPGRPTGPDGASGLRNVIARWRRRPLSASSSPGPRCGPGRASGRGTGSVSSMSSASARRSSARSTASSGRPSPRPATPSSTARSSCASSWPQPAGRASGASAGAGAATPGVVADAAGVTGTPVDPRRLQRKTSRPVSRRPAPAGPEGDA